MESVGYGPPDKINKKNLMELAAPNKTLILNKIKDYKKRGPRKALHKAVCGKNFCVVLFLLLFMS